MSEEKDKANLARIERTRSRVMAAKMPEAEKEDLFELLDLAHDASNGSPVSKAVGGLIDFQVKKALRAVPNNWLAVALECKWPIAVMVSAIAIFSPHVSQILDFAARFVK